MVSRLPIASVSSASQTDCVTDLSERGAPEYANSSPVMDYSTSAAVIATNCGTCHATLSRAGRRLKG